MNIEKLFTKESTVKISILKIDNKKFTKSIFNQLNYKNPFDRDINLNQDAKFLGYVNDKGKWILWTDTDYIYKFELKKLIDIKWIDVDRHKISDLIEVYPTEKVKDAFHYVDDYDNEYKNEVISNVLNREEIFEFIEKQDIVKNIINETLQRQIFF